MRAGYDSGDLEHSRSDTGGFLQCHFRFADPDNGSHHLSVSTAKEGQHAQDTGRGVARHLCAVQRPGYRTLQLVFGVSGRFAGDACRVPSLRHTVALSGHLRAMHYESTGVPPFARGVSLPRSD